MAGGGPDQPDRHGGSRDRSDDPAESALARWSAEGQVSDAVAQRRRARGLARQAAGEVDLAAVVTALGERGRPVLVGLIGGRRHRGRITLVGTDVVGLATGPGPVWLALGAVSWIRAVGEPITAGADASTAEPSPGAGVRRVSLADELDELAGDRSRVAVVALGSDDALVGELTSVGRDVVTVRDDGGGLIYVALASVAEVSVPESG